MSNIGKGRILRVCDLCGGVDDHPRHVIAGPTPDVFVQPAAVIVRAVMANAPADEQDRLLNELIDTSSSDRHMDCCRKFSCPDGSCNVVTEGAEDKRGAALLKHLVGLGDVAPGNDAIVKGATS